MENYNVLKSHSVMFAARVNAAGVRTIVMMQFVEKLEATSSH